MRQTPDRGPRPAWIGLAVRILLALGLLGLVLWLNRDQVREVLARRPNVGAFAVAFGLYLAGVLLAYTRWFLLVRAAGIPFGPLDALRLGLVGTLFNLVIPGAIGGDFVKAAFLCRERPAFKTQAIASVFVDRVVGLIGLFALAAATGAWAWPALEPKTRRLVVIACVALIVATGVLALAFAVHPRGPVARLLSRRPKGARLVAELCATGVSYRSRLPVVALGVLMGAVTHTGNVLAFYAINRALYPMADLPTVAQHFMIVPLVLFSTAIPLPFGALGATEQISASLFRLAERYRGGAVAMMGFRCLQYLLAMVAAGVYAADRQQVRSLREEAQQLAEEPATSLS